MSKSLQNLRQFRAKPKVTPAGVDADRWKERALAAESLLKPMLPAATNYRKTAKKQVVADTVEAMHAFVEDCNWGILRREYSSYPAVERLLSALTSNTYDRLKYARSKGYDLEEYGDATEWKQVMRKSYLLGMLARQKSEHHVPYEQILTGLIAYRCGLPKKLWRIFTGYGALPSKLVIKDIIEQLMKKPFVQPKRGRIGLGAYDNCAYSRKFSYQRVGNWKSTKINTANSIDIPIGPFQQHVDADTKVWKDGRRDIVHEFRPMHVVTRMHMQDVCFQAWQRFAIDDAESMKLWDYPWDVDPNEG